MVFKPFSHISRHAALAKNLWVSSSNQTQPAFFVSTSQLHRHQSQVAVWGSNSFGQSNERNSSTTSNAYPSIGSASSLTTLSPLTTLDDERQREVVAEGIASERSAYKSRLKLRPVTFSRRYSTAREDDVKLSIESKEKQSDDIFKEDLSEKVELRAKDDEAIGSVESSSKTLENIETLESLSESLQSENDSIEQHELADPISPACEVISSSDLASDLADLTEPTSTKPASVDLSELVNDHEIPAEPEREAQIAALSELLKSPSTYNQRLKEIASQTIHPHDSVADLGPLLNTYAEMLKNKIVPNQETYEILIPQLLQAAFARKALAKSTTPFRGLIKRHRETDLSSVGMANEEKFKEAESYFKLAINLYCAGNTIKTKKYNYEFTLNLLNACIEFNDMEHFTKIMESFSVWNAATKPDGYVVAVRGFGRTGDLASAKRVFAAYRENVSKSYSQTSDVDMYTAMIGTLLACSQDYEAVKLFQRVLNGLENEKESESNIKGLATEIITGFATMGDLETAWKWIREFDNDKKMPRLELSSITSVFSKLCMHGEVELANEMFDYMAIRQDSRDDLSFNEARSDFMMMAIKANNMDLVFKGIKETLARNGVWDECTLLMVVKYLCQLSEPMQAVSVLNYQVPRLFDLYKAYSGEGSIAVLSTELLASIVAYLKSTNGLDLEMALGLASSPLVNSRAPSQAESGGIDILETIWQARSENPGTLFGLYGKSASTMKNIIALHVTWILSAAQNSPGTLSSSAPMAEKIRQNFVVFVNDTIAESIPLPFELKTAITESLDALDDSATLAKWKEFLERPVSSIPSANYTSSDNQAALPVFNSELTAQVIAYAHMKDTLQKAYLTLESSIMSGRGLVAPEGIMAVMAAANAQKTLPIISETYRLCLKHVPFPGSSYQAWDSWVLIHRAVVQHAAELDYPLAMDAYMNLLQMGSSPDATGYGHLIAHAPMNATRDEASDAVRLFNEARSRGVAPNTFLYNVVLSRLSKARRFKESLLIFQEMDREGVKKSSVTYGTMISACCRAGEGLYAAQLFDEMERSPSYVPKIAPFNIMLQYYVHTMGDRKMALAMYERLRSSGLNPSAHTYKLLIDMYSTIQPVDLKAADQVLLTILQDGNVITTQHYAALLLARGVALKDLDATIEFYESLKRNKRVRPDKLIFQSLLESYVVNRRIKETTQVLNEMLGYGIELNAYMANILIRGWALVDLNKSVGLFNHILETNLLEPSSYESMIKAFLFHNDITNAYNMLTLMRSSGYPEPVINKVESLINSHLASGMLMTETSLLVDSIFRQDSVHRLGVETVDSKNLDLHNHCTEQVVS